MDDILTFLSGRLKVTPELVEDCKYYYNIDIDDLVQLIGGLELTDEEVNFHINHVKSLFPNKEMIFCLNVQQGSKTIFSAYLSSQNPQYWNMKEEKYLPAKTFPSGMTIK